MVLGSYLSNLKRIDWLLLAPVILLSLFGLAKLYSGTLNVTEPNWIFFNKQLIFFVIGLGLLLVVSMVDYRRWRNYSWLLYLSGLVLMLAVLWWGETIRGATGWFYFLGFGFQPAELTKFVLVLALAYLYHKRRGKEHRWLTIILVGLITLMPIILALQQPDFGSAVIFISIGVGFFVLINLKKKHLPLIIISAVLLFILLWNCVLLDYQKERIMNFIKPMRDPLGEGYNVRQAIIAVGSGGLFGRGLGLGSQSQLRFLPEIESDFIFASITEALGFLGAVLIIFFFVLIFFRLIVAMKNARDNFSLYVIYGFGLIFFIQTIINIGMNIGLFPATGLSLPFVSYGGSFLLMSMMAVGLIESIIIRQKII